MPRKGGIKKKRTKKSLDPLEAIKRLLILQLVRDGVTSEEIANVLGIDSSTIRRIAPASKVGKNGANKKN